MEPRQRLTFAAIAAVIAVVAVVLLVASGGSDDSNTTAGSQKPTTDTGSQTTPAPTQDSGGAEAEPAQTPTATAKPKPKVTVIRVRDAEPVGGIKAIEVKQGEQIRFKVKSDVADEVHFHGYDVSEDVAPGQDANFNVKATITGIFEAELEDRGTQIASIRVDP